MNKNETIMNKFFTLLTLFGIVVSSQLNAQSFTEQILNKEQFKSAVSLTQDYDNDGDLDIIVSRWEPAGIYVLENDETKQFPATPIITENLTFYIADIDMADFDNDGDIDYAVCFTNVNDGELAWFQRQDDGTYVKWTIATNIDFIEAVVGDFNNDNLPDIATVGLNNSNNECRIYFNQGNLFFAEDIIANEVGDGIDAKDLDNDGDLDLAITDIGFINTQVDTASGTRTLINNGQGSFSVGHYLNSTAGNSTSHWETIRIVDFNQDGIQDIFAFSSNGLGDGLHFYDGTAIGQYNDLEGVFIDDDNDIDLAGDLVVFDIDNNGLLDIVRQAKGANRISVLYQLSNFTFERQYIDLNWDNCCNPTAKMSYGDLDDDGDLDLIFPEQGNVDHDISWFENINGQLFKHQIYGELHGVRIPKMVDWDNDGDLDIFATAAGGSGFAAELEDELILYENIDGENFINWRLNDALDYAADVEFADIDGDGDLDAFATARDADDLVWLRNDGFQANWVTDTIFSEGNNPLGIASDDLDNDGDADVVMCSWNDDKVFGFLNNGSGNFSPIVIDANIDGPREVEIIDLDNDGDKDVVVVATETENSVVIYFNDGSENFTEQIIFTNEIGRDIEVGDWNQDGTPDIFACFSDSDIHVVGFIYDSGNYILDTFQLQNDDVLSIKLSDIDGDSDLDIISGHDGGTSNSDPVLYANILNEGEIESSVPLSDDGDIHGIDIGDVNNDGILDIVYADFQHDDLVLLTIGCLVAPTPSIAVEDAICSENNGSATIDISIFNNPIFEWSNGGTTEAITNLEAGDYEVTITDSNGCSSTGSISIEEIPTAEIEVSGTNTTCGNEDGLASVSAISGNIVSYQWSNGENTTTISNLSGGNYLITAIDENNCEIIDSIEIEGLVNPVVELGDDIIIIEGESITLDATGNGLTYEWSTGEITPTIEVSETGTYSVTVINSQGCISMDEIEVTTMTGVNELEENIYLTVYPNPTDDRVLVTVSKDGLDLQELKLITVSGKTIWEEKLNPNQLQIEFSVEGLPNGPYLIYIRTPNGYLTKKLIKE